MVHSVPKQGPVGRGACPSCGSQVSRRHDGACSACGVYCPTQEEIQRVGAEIRKKWLGNPHSGKVGPRAKGDKRP